MEKKKKMKLKLEDHKMVLFGVECLADYVRREICEANIGVFLLGIWVEREDL